MPISNFIEQLDGRNRDNAIISIRNILKKSNDGLEELELVSTDGKIGENLKEIFGAKAHRELLPDIIEAKGETESLNISIKYLLGGDLE